MLKLAIPVHPSVPPEQSFQDDVPIFSAQLNSQFKPI
jgi:hypothetical protein